MIAVSAIRRTAPTSAASASNGELRFIQHGMLAPKIRSAGIALPDPNAVVKSMRRNNCGQFLRVVAAIIGGVFPHRDLSRLALPQA
jgi:hypothetical protein